MNRIHHTKASVFAAIAERGPLRRDELRAFLYPGNLTEQTRRGGVTEKRSDTAHAHASGLEQLGLLRSDDKHRWRFTDQVGCVWAVYFATDRVLAGVYDAHTRLISKTDSADEPSCHERAVPGGTENQRDLEYLLEIGAACLMDAVSTLAGPTPGCYGVVVALPAAIENGRRVLDRVPRGWRARVEDIPSRFEQAWRAEAQRRGDATAELPKLQGQTAIRVETDIVVDTLGTMYAAEPDGTDRLACRNAVLGVKHSGALRAAYVTRAPSYFDEAGRFRGRELRRQPGTTGPQILRGATGATPGIGHMLAPVNYMRDIVHSDSEMLAIEAFVEDIKTQGMACTCGAVGVPHFDNLVSSARIAQRLGLDRASSIPEILDRASADPDDALRDVLQETGHLVGLAVDYAARLLQPEIVLVSGTLPHDGVMWASIQRALTSVSDGAWPVVRARDTGARDVRHDPIGPRGAAWLALDTYLHPEWMRRLSVRRSRASPANDTRPEERRARDIIRGY